jgi:tetratricopeptide (TPR) repeat protein/predicted phosphodiesterase
LTAPCEFAIILSMSSESFSWLHLTDFHFGLPGQKFLWPNLRQPFLDDLADLHQRTGPWQAVLFTGDFVQQGKSDEFREMQKEVLDRLWEKLRELGSGDAVLLAVPGNHDLYRPNPIDDNPALDALLDKDGFSRIAAKFWDNPAGAYRRVINDSFAAYSEWWKAAPNRPKNLTAGILPGDFACTLHCGGRRIGIVGLNTTYLQLQGGDYQGKLVWDVRQLDAVCGGAIDDWLNQHHVCLLLTHQGPDWLTPEARKHGETEIAPPGRFAVHLFGHMHETRLDSVHKIGEGNATRLWQCCSVFGMELFGEPPHQVRSHGYAAGRIEFRKKSATLRLWPRIATSKTGSWRYIPDHEHANLEDDQGTKPEKINVQPLETATSGLTPKKKSLPIKRKATQTPSTTAPSIPHSTLPSRRPFFGREKELASIAKALHPDHVGWGVVLDGPGGIGKTALALEAAHLAPAEHYPLKLFITAKGRILDPEGEHELKDHRVDDFYALLTEIGLALGRDDASRAAPDKRPDLVRHALAENRALLVLDNLESFNPAERRRVYDLLEALPRTCRAIVTTRRRDDTAARTLRLDKLDADAAGQLLDSLGQKWPPIAKLTSEERHRLYTETGGNPLLLTWTAGQLGRTKGRCHTVEEAIERLQEAHRLQKINEKNDPLEFIFGDLLDTFTDDETDVLAALAHFTQPARLAWLLPLAELSETAALTALDDLRNRALLIEDDTTGTWFLPPLAARFLRQRRPDSVGAAGQRLADEAYALALQHGKLKNAPFTELEAAWPTVQAALPLLIAGDNARLQKLCDAIVNFLDFTGHWDEWLSLNQEAEAKALAGSDYDNAGWRAYHVGTIHDFRGEAEALVACAERCAGHWRQAGTDVIKQSIAILLRGHGHRLQKDYPAAIAIYEGAIDLWYSINPESNVMSIGLNDLAEVKLESGDLDGAEADYREALRIAFKKRNREGVATYTGNLTDVFLKRQDWPAAERQAAEALELAKGVGRQELIASDHHRLAQAMLHQQRAAEALPHAQEAVAIFTHLRSRDLAEAQATQAACQAACSSS